MEAACLCEDKKLVRRQIANGATQFGTQCQRCGKWAAVAKATLTPGQITFAESFDDSISERFWQEFRAKQQAARLQQTQAERDAWFRKYTAYLRSPQWRDKRERVIKRDGGICQACLKRQATQVHHLTYKHVFNEPLFDLTSICDLCHDFLTKLDRGELECQPQQQQPTSAN